MFLLRSDQSGYDRDIALGDAHIVYMQHTVISGSDLQAYKCLWLDWIKLIGSVYYVYIGQGSLI